MNVWFALHESLRSRLSRRGLDLLAALNTAWEEEIADPALLSIPGFPDGAYAAVIGNTRGMWETFVEAIRRDPGRLEQSDPLDTWVEEQVRSALRPVAIDYRILWGHEPSTSGAYPPLQQYAERAGLASVSETQLSVHPLYGPWIALRAAVVFDTPGPPGRPPARPSVCESCDAACRDALQRALRATEGGEVDGVREAWECWVEVRDACSAGADYRYSDEQIRYHYRKERSILARAAGLENGPD